MSEDRKSAAENAPPPDADSVVDEIEKPSLKERVVRGTAVTIIGQAAKNGLRLISNLILTRILFPEAFGVMALVNLVIIGLAMLSDLGVHTSIIQHERGDDREFRDTAWTIQVARGGMLWVLGAAIAIPWSKFYEEPQLALLVPVATAVAVFQGLESTKLPALSRHMRLARLMALELIAQVVSIVTMIGFALVLKNVWALVYGGLAQAITLMILSFAAIDGPRDRFRWEPRAAKAILTFGGWIFLSTLVTFVALRLDVLILGKLTRLGELGVYHIATMFAGLPIQVAGPVVGAVLLPTLSEAFRDDPEVMRGHFRTAQRAIVPVGMFATLGPVLLGPTLFFYFYDARYHDAAWIVQLAMLSTWFLYLQECWTQALLAVGDSRGLVIPNTLKVVLTGGASVGGYYFFDLPGFMIGAAVGAAAGYAVVVLNLRRHGLYPGTLDLMYTGVGLAIGVSAARLPRELSARLGWDLPLCSTVVGLLVVVPLGLWAGRTILRQIRSKTPQEG